MKSSGLFSAYICAPDVSRAGDKKKVTIKSQFKLIHLDHFPNF